MANICKSLRVLAYVVLLGLGMLLATMPIHAQLSRDDLVKICVAGTVDELVAAIATGADVNSVDDYGNTLLMIVALDRTGSAADKAKLLLQAKVDPVKKNLDGRTALHAASDEANLDLVKTLIDTGADVNAVTNIGLTPLNLACFKHHQWEQGKQEAVVRALLKAGADVTISGSYSLDAAAASAGPETVRLLLEAGYKDVNHVNKLGRTALMNAAKYNSSSEVASLLLNAGAKADLRDLKGETALDQAKQNPAPAVDEIINILKSAR